MGKFSKLTTAGIFTVLFLSSLVWVPLAFIFAFVLLGGGVVYLMYESYSLSHRYVMKTFYCPFRKMVVEAKFRPSIFTFRTYDDVLKCSAFEDEVRCQKRCLDMPESKLDS